ASFGERASTVAPTAPARPTRTAAPADPMAAWARLLDGIEARSPKLAGLYHTARLVSWTERAIELGTSNTFASDPDSLKDLKKLIAEVTGTPVDVKIVPDAPQSATAAPARSLAEVDAERKEALQKKHEEEARAH